MKFKFLFIMILIQGQFSHAQDKKWTWAGFEVVGLKSVSRNEIIGKIPIQLGSEVKDEYGKWQVWCENIKTHFNFLYVKCGRVGFINFKSYFEVSIVEQGEADRIKFREINGDFPELPGQVLEIFDKLTARMWVLFDMGNPPNETWDNGHLEYDDHEMMSYVRELLDIVPTIREKLVQTINSNPDEVVRAKSARLLNWALNTHASIEEIEPFLADPSDMVRNNITRFILHYVGGIENPELHKKLIKAFIIQMERPSHGDRNKALFALRELLDKHKSLSALVKKLGYNQIKYLSENSVVSNVKGAATEILKTLDSEP